MSPPPTASTEYKAERIAAFIAERAHLLPDKGARPLIVSMQGPQGAGKSTVAAALVARLREEHGLSCAVASLDDFYLDHAGLRAVAAASPENALLAGRGPPGTHDLPLLAGVLARLRDGPAPSTADPLELPVFDKAPFNGEGDRAREGVRVTRPVDVFVLEGWSLGYGPRKSSVVEEEWAAGAVARRHPLASLRELNDNLARVEDAVGGAFDCHIAIRPTSYAYVYDWRREQEHALKAANGGQGMSDDAVRAFVDRYMPVYEVFGETTPRRHTLALDFGPEREVVGEARWEGLQAVRR